MKTYFKIKEGKLVLCEKEEATVRVFNAPDDSERIEIVEMLGIDNHNLDSALDPDEISRVEFDRQRTSIIWKLPYKGTHEGSTFDVTSMGFFLDDTGLTIISSESTESLSQTEFRSMNTLNGFLMRYFSYTTRQYLVHLKQIKQTTAQLESEIGSSLANEAFLKMFDLSERLVYYMNAIEANGAVLTKLRDRVERFELSIRQIGFLDDIILENKQSARQAQIYSTVLSGLMDARGNMINNNMTTLLKNLTLITVVFLPLNLIASIGGMSEFTMMIENFGITWEIGYPLFFLAIVAIGWITMQSIRRFITRR